MPRDTLVEFDPPQTPRGDLVERRYQPALWLHNSALAAIRIQANGRHADMLAEARSWPETMALWLTVPSRAFANPGLPTRLRGMLGGLALAPERVSLELPEAAASGVAHDGLLRLSALRDIGVGLILSEFGAAIASLQMLRRLPLTAIKLSPALVDGLPADREDAGLAGAAITAARSCGLAVIADGITSTAQSAWLAGEGCAVGLGPLLAKPMAAGQLHHWLRRS